MAVAGKVAITLSTENGGAWSADVTYDRLVAVKHNNNLYISRKTVANVEPPNNEFWFLALEGFSGDDIEDIINGTTQVGNAKTLDGHGAEDFAKANEIFNVSFVEKIFTAYTPEELDEYLINIHANANSGEWYRVVVRCSVLHPVFGGFAYYLEGFRWHENYGYQKMTSYSGNGRAFERAIYEGTWGDWENTATTADLANYLPLTGGRLTRYDTAILELASTYRNTSLISFFGTDGHLGYLGLDGFNNPCFTENAGVPHTLLHTGNKPSGSYTGNGDATARTINTCGIGNALVINGPYTTVWVGNNGAIGIYQDSATVGILNKSEMFFKDGVLTISTAKGLVNESGETFTYQVL